MVRREAYKAVVIYDVMLKSNAVEVKTKGQTKIVIYGNVNKS